MNKKLKGLFFCNTNYDFDDVAMNPQGIAKKILTQVKTLSDSGLRCSIIQFPYFPKGHYFLRLKCLFSGKYFFEQVAHIDFSDIDFIYIRKFVPTSLAFLSMIKAIKKQNKHCIFLLELPTYPYDFEHKGLKGFIVLAIDKVFRKKLKQYIHYIITYSDHDSIFGMQTLKMMNGIECHTIAPVTAESYTDSVHLIAVAQFCEWHGYDRLIKGLYEYYKSCPSRAVYLSLVGDGAALCEYKDAVEKYRLQKYVTFHGVLFGEALTSVFNRADIAVCSLGGHRKCIFLSSELKSREYLARGLPMISSIKIDVLPADYPYIQYVPENETVVDIPQVLSFYDALQKKESRPDQIKHIRCFAEQNCDMRITMQPVINAILSSRSTV